MKDKKILYCSPTFQNLIRKTLKLVFNNYFNVNVHGKENIPKKGSLIFSCNHTNNLDPLILAGQTKRITYAMSKKELCVKAEYYQKEFEKINEIVKNDWSMDIND